jgi:cytochrome c nitrite reductase small subunit
MNRRIIYTLLGLVVAAIVGFFTFHQVEKASEKAGFCIMCHNMQPEYDTFTKGNLLAKKHNDANVTCHKCHVPTMGEQLGELKMYVTGNFKMPTEQRGFKNEQCTGCHKIKDIRKKTAHYGKANPHESWHNKGNEMLQCQSCHAVHHPQKLNKCTSCHPIDWKVDSSWKKMPLPDQK